VRKPTFTSTGIGLFALSLALQATSTRAGEYVEQPAEPYFAFCRTGAELANTFYFSPTRPIDAGVSRQDLQDSFRAFLAKTYQYPSSNVVTCMFAVSGELQANTESSRQQTMDNLRAAHFEVVEVDWTYAK
jgi:hypothetical protein